MDAIQKVLVVGRGAVGGLFGTLIEEKIGDRFAFLCDEDRKARYQQNDYVVNGVKTTVRYVSPADAYPVDLVLIATKASGFADAMEQIKPFLKPDTILVSCLNGIESDETLMRAFSQPVSRAISQKMDARYHDGELTYSSTGELVIGMEQKSQKEAFEALVDFFERIRFPYVASNDIVHDQYSKLMLNCGINQVCAIHRATYGNVMWDPELHRLFVDTMKETRDVLATQGVRISDAEIESWEDAIARLDPDSMPSMAQDVLAGRKTEVDLFAKTIMDIAKKAGVPAPVNTMLYGKIKEIEKR